MLSAIQVLRASALHCRAGSSANNLGLLNFEYLAIYLCAYNLECNQSLSLPTSHSMQPHGTMEESSADRNQCLGRLRAQSSATKGVVKTGARGPPSYPSVGADFREKFW